MFQRRFEEPLNFSESQITYGPWPAAEESLLVQNTVKLPVQVCQPSVEHSESARVHYNFQSEATGQLRLFCITRC